MSSLASTVSNLRNSSSPPVSTTEDVARSGVAVRTPRARVTLVAADPHLRATVRELLEGEDYNVDALETVDDALNALAALTPELVVYAPAHDLDGEITHFSVATKAGLIVLTPTAGDAGVIRALDAGADDAVPPPYARGELLARVRCALRRSQAKSARSERVFGDLVLDVESRELDVDNRRVTLTRLEFRLLEELMLAGGLALRHDDLLSRVWGPSHRGRLNYLRVYVARLRRKIEIDPARPRIIFSVPGVGYKLGSPTASESGVEQAAALGDGSETILEERDEADEA